MFVVVCAGFLYE